MELELKAQRFIHLEGTYFFDKTVLKVVAFSPAD
ncbi:MAG: hypothetical protein ACJAQ2_002025 [Vicingaceae bacterium]|jgi:hypothetical protein